MRFRTALGPEGEAAHPDRPDTRGKITRLIGDAISSDRGASFGDLGEPRLAPRNDVVRRPEAGDRESVAIRLLPAEPAITCAARSENRGARVVDLDLRRDADERASIA